jgi:hypothetical protein
VQNISIVVLAGYKDIFGSNSKSAFEKINKYPLQVVLLELIGINYALRGNSDLYSNMSIKVQESLFRRWLGDDKYVLALYDKLNTFSRSVNNKQVLVFNRASCLFGIDYCYRNLKSTEQKFDYTRGFWIDLIEFCLACNEVVT